MFKNPLKLLWNSTSHVGL